MSALEAVSVTRLYRMIADQIAGKIKAGVFAVGERLPAERELARILRVSRPSVREALIALEIEGYVEVRVGTGVFVVSSGAATEPVGTQGVIGLSHTRYSDVGPFDLLEARFLLEPECAALAAANATDTELTLIEAAAIAPTQFPGQQDRAFHIAIAEASGNMALAAAVTTLWDLRANSAIFTRLEQHFVTHKVWAVVEHEHDLVFQAIKSRNPQAARQAMRAHLSEITRRLHEDFNEDIK